VHDNGHFDEPVAAKYDEGAADRVALPVAACSMPFRYVWPAELDLMAALAGMRLRTLGATSKREQFESRSHVSVWQKPA
jgi:hypothetical protein